MGERERRLVQLRQQLAVAAAQQERNLEGSAAGTRNNAIREFDNSMQVTKRTVQLLHLDVPSELYIVKTILIIEILRSIQYRS